MYSFYQSGEREALRTILGVSVASVMLWHTFILMPLQLFCVPIQDDELKGLRNNENVLRNRVNRIEKACFDKGIM